MDFSRYTFWELNKLYYQLGVEYIKRIWIVLVVMLIILSIAQAYLFKKK